MKPHRFPIFAAMAAAVILLLPSPNAQAWQFFTNEAIFTNTVATNAFTETFASIPVDTAMDTLTNLAGNGFSFDATTTTNTLDSALYGLATDPPDKWLSVYGPENVIVFTNFSENVTAIGGNFFPTDYGGQPVSGTIQLTAQLANLTSISTNVAAASATNFFGFAFDSPIRSFSISSTNDAFPTAHNVTLATTINTNPVIVVEDGSLFYSFVGGTNLSTSVETTTNLTTGPWTTNGVITLPTEEITPDLIRYRFEAPLGAEHQRFMRAIIDLPF